MEPSLCYLVLSLAGREGLEPPLPGPKPGVLPLDDLPTSRHIVSVLGSFFNAKKGIDTIA